MKQMDGELGTVETTTTRVGRTMQNAFAIGATAIAAGTAAAAAGAGAVLNLANSYAEAGSQIFDLSQRTGFSTEALSEWKYAADQSGASIEGLEVGIRRMSSTVVDAGNGLDSAKDILKGLGVSVSELNGLQPEQIFNRMVAALASVDDETTRAALATDLFGRSGTQLLPLLADGTEGLEALKQEAREAGVVFSQDAAAAADAFGDDMLRLEREIQGVKYQIASELLPALTPMIDEFQSWIDQNGAEFARDTAEAIAGVAEKTSELVGWLGDVASFGPIRVAIDVAANMSGDELAIATTALLVGSRFGPIGLGLGALTAGVAAITSGQPTERPIGGPAGARPAGAPAPVGVRAGGSGSNFTPSVPSGMSDEDAFLAAEEALARAAGWVPNENGPITPPRASAGFAAGRGAGGVSTARGGGAGGAKKAVEELTEAERALARIREDQAAEIERAYVTGGIEAVNALRQLHAEQDATWEAMKAQAREDGYELTDTARDAWQQMLEDQKAANERMNEENERAFEELERIRQDAIDDMLEAEKKAAEERKRILDDENQDVFNRTRQLWAAAGPNLSTGNALSLARQAELGAILNTNVNNPGLDRGYTIVNYGTQNLALPNVVAGQPLMPSTADSLP
ncbi:MAG TPA: hypothetical protein VEA63_07035 [Opitutus sp.]|nr:hypothetical protein [Opitutus sp.]